jgi:transcriptional regulator with XRE-family HTH domain
VIGTRIRAQREWLGLTQEELSRSLGFNDRQTISAIETGRRRISIDELDKFSKILLKPVEFFLDPFQLADEASFAWQHNGLLPSMFDEYKPKAGRIIAVFRTLADGMGRQPPLLRRSLPLIKVDPYEHAVNAGERFAAEFNMGASPGAHLIEVMEREFGILVLMLDTPLEISSVLCHLPDLDAVIINRRNTRSCRFFSLARALFHFLTWDVMPPSLLENIALGPRGRVGRHADFFAQSLLMPRTLLTKFGPWSNLHHNDLAAKLNVISRWLGMNPSFLETRLVNGGFLPREAIKSLQYDGPCPLPDQDEIPPLFSSSFIQTIFAASHRGHMSLSRSAELLELTIEELKDIANQHEISLPPTRKSPQFLDKINHD